jgi:hypothetical protein
MGKQPVATSVVSTTLTRRQLKLKQEQEKLDKSGSEATDTNDVSVNNKSVNVEPVETTPVAKAPTGNKRGRKPKNPTPGNTSTVADVSMTETVNPVKPVEKETPVVAETTTPAEVEDVPMEESEPQNNSTTSSDKAEQRPEANVVSPKVLAELTTNQEQPQQQLNVDNEISKPAVVNTGEEIVVQRQQEVITDMTGMTEEEMRADIKSVKKIKAAAREVMDDDDVGAGGDDDDDEDDDESGDSDMDDMEEYETDPDEEQNDSENKLNGSGLNASKNKSKDERDKLRRRLPISIKELIDYHSGNGKSIKEIVTKINQVCKSEEKVSYGYVQKYLYRKKLEATTAKKARYYRKKYGFVYRRMRRKPVLTEHHRSLRMQWCGKYQDDKFDKDIFIGKTALKPFLASLNQLKGQPADPDQPKQQTTLHLWGAISRKGASPLQV